MTRNTESPPKSGEFSLTEVRQLGIVQFNEPLLIEWALDEKDRNLAHVAYNTPHGTIWDECPLTAAHNFIARDGGTPEEIIKATVEFDIAHAFWHFPDDPNYTKLHWALWGALHEHCATWEDHGLTRREPAVGPQELRRAYVKEARKNHQTPGACEIQEGAQVNPQPDGAFVQAWIWVPKAAINFCPQCQAGPERQEITGRPAVGTLIRCSRCGFDRIPAMPILQNAPSAAAA